MDGDQPAPMTPEELASYPLRRATRGYAVSEVDDLLDRLAAQLQMHADERAELEERLRGAAAARAELQQRLDSAESTADRVVSAAREVADAVVQDSRREADAVLSDARARAADHLREAERRGRLLSADAEERAREAEAHVDRLRRFVDDHRERISEHLRRELSRLDAIVVPRPPASRGLAPDPLAEPMATLDPLLPSAGSPQDRGRSRDPDDQGPPEAGDGAADADVSRSPVPGGLDTGDDGVEAEHEPTSGPDDDVDPDETLFSP